MWNIIIFIYANIVYVFLTEVLKIKLWSFKGVLLCLLFFVAISKVKNLIENNRN